MDDHDLPAEPLSAGFTRQLLNAGQPGQIVVFVFTDITVETVNTWMSSLRATVDTWPPGQPYLALYDLSNVQHSIREYQYAFDQMREFRQEYPDLVTRIACILQNSLIGELGAQALQLFA